MMTEPTNKTPWKAQVIGVVIVGTVILGSFWDTFNPLWLLAIACVIAGITMTAFDKSGGSILFTVAVIVVLVIFLKPDNVSKIGENIGESLANSQNKAGEYNALPSNNRAGALEPITLSPGERSVLFRLDDTTCLRWNSVDSRQEYQVLSRVDGTWIEGGVNGAQRIAFVNNDDKPIIIEIYRRNGYTSCALN